MASLCDDHGYVVEKLKLKCKDFLTIDIAATTSHKMYFKWSFCQFSFDAMFLVWNKMSFGRVFGSGTWLDRRCLAFICDIASLQESDIFPFNSVVTVWLDHCWYLVQDCALTVVWVCDDGSFSFLFFTSLVFAHLSGSCFYSSICNSTLSSPFKVEGPFPLFCQGFYHLKIFDWLFTTIIPW